MIIGSLDVEQIDGSTHYTICNLDNHKNSPFFLLLIQSFLCFHSISYDHNNTYTHEQLLQLEKSLQIEQVTQPPSSSFLHCSLFITSLDEFILSNSFTVKTAHLLLRSLYAQIQFFMDNNVSISFIELNDIMTIDGTQFYFCNTGKMYTIKKNKMITINQFYDVNNHFIPPEFIHNINMPFSTYYTSSYYSLAIIILFCLHYSHNNVQANAKANAKVAVADVAAAAANANANANSQIQNKDTSLLSYMNKRAGISTYQYLLDKYQNSKLYYSLMLCLAQDPVQRKLFVM